MITKAFQDDRLSLFGMGNMRLPTVLLMGKHDLIEERSEINGRIKDFDSLFLS